MGGVNSKVTMPFPENAFKDFHNIYLSENMYAAIIKIGFDMYPGTHAHDGYEFLMPITDMPYVCIDDKVISCSKNTVLPINPWQRHGIAQKSEKIRFIDVVVDRLYIEEVYRSLCGESLKRLKNETVNASFEIQSIIKRFVEEAKENGLGRDMMMKSLCCQFSIQVIRSLCSGIKENSPKSDGINENKIAGVLDYLNGCYYKDCSVDSLAEIAGMSKYHLIRFFRQMTGKSPYDYLLDIRIAKAKDLLLKKDLPITNIAVKCGFNYASHFSYVFKKRMGISPGKFREMLRP